MNYGLMKDVLVIQYDLVKQARTVLLSYCGQLTEKDFLAENSSFGRGSIRNLLVHIGNTYEFWLGKQALQKEIIFTAYNTVKNVTEAEELFRNIDRLVNRFIFSFADDYHQEIMVSINKEPVAATPLKLFTHVITHEFHHKGQILSLSRHLGYVPIDTDIMR